MADRRKLLGKPLRGLLYHKLGSGAVPQNFGPIVGACSPGLERLVGAGIAGFDEWTYGPYIVRGGSNTVLNIGGDSEGVGGPFVPGFSNDERAFQSPIFTIPDGCRWFGLSFHAEVFDPDPVSEDFGMVLFLAAIPSDLTSNVVEDGTGSNCLYSEPFEESSNPSDNGMMFHEIRGGGEIDSDCLVDDLTMIHQFVPGTYTSFYIRGYYNSDRPKASNPLFPASVNIELSNFKFFTAAGL